MFVTVTSALLYMMNNHFRQNGYQDMRAPPPWSPENARNYSFQRWSRDVLIWSIVSELEPARKAALTISRLQGSAAEFAQQLPADRVIGGGMINGQRADPMTWLMHQLYEHYGQLGEEVQLAAMRDLMEFGRRPNERVDELLARFDTVRNRANELANLGFGVQGYTWLLLRALNITDQQLMQLLQPTGGRMPNNAQEFNDMRAQLRRMGHILEGNPGNVASTLRSTAQQAFFVGQDGQSTVPQQPDNNQTHAYVGWANHNPWSPPSQPGYSYLSTAPVPQHDGYFPGALSQAYMSHDGAPDYDSGTDTDTVSSHGDTPMDAVSQPPNLHAQNLYWAYQQAKSKWRKFTGKPVRKVRRFLKREKGKGKSKGKGKVFGKGNYGAPTAGAYLATLTDTHVEQVFAIKGGKGKRSSGKGFGKSGQTNPKGPDGRPLECHECGSDTHLVAQCTARQNRERAHLAVEDNHPSWTGFAINNAEEQSQSLTADIDVGPISDMLVFMTRETTAVPSDPSSNATVPVGQPTSLEASSSWQSPTWQLNVATESEAMSSWSMVPPQGPPVSHGQYANPFSQHYHQNPHLFQPNWQTQQAAAQPVAYAPQGQQPQFVSPPMPSVVSAPPGLYPALPDIPPFPVPTVQQNTPVSVFQPQFNFGFQQQQPQRESPPTPDSQQTIQQQLEPSPPNDPPNNNEHETNTEHVQPAVNAQHAPNTMVMTLPPAEIPAWARMQEFAFVQSQEPGMPMQAPATASNATPVFGAQVMSTLDETQLHMLHSFAGVQYETERGRYYPTVYAHVNASTSASAVIDDTEMSNILGFAQAQQESERLRALRKGRGKGKPWDKGPDNVPQFSGTNTECTLCLESFVHLDPVTRLQCGHVFHVRCFENSNSRIYTCPNCRGSARVLARYLYILEGQQPAANQQLFTEQHDTHDIATPRSEVPEDFQSVHSTPTRNFMPWWPSSLNGIDVFIANPPGIPRSLGIIIDPGAYTNLAGKQWIRKMCALALKHKYFPEQLKMEHALSVAGVGNGTRTCTWKAKVPIATEFSTAVHYFDVPIVEGDGEDLPALLGLKSMSEKKAVLIMEVGKEELVFPGAQGYKIEWPPGTTRIPLRRAQTGHLVMLTDQFEQLAKESKQGGLPEESMTLLAHE